MRLARMEELGKMLTQQDRKGSILSVFMRLLMTEVCPNVATEPHLQPLTGESFRLASTNINDGARLDIRARSFWTAGQDTFFDVRVFHPNAPSNRSRRLSAVYKRHEDEKKRTYGQRILEIEHSVFTPLVMTQPPEAWV